MNAKQILSLSLAACATGAAAWVAASERRRNRVGAYVSGCAERAHLHAQLADIEARLQSIETSVRDTSLRFSQAVQALSESGRQRLSAAPAPPEADDWALERGEVARALRRMPHGRA